jgi:hypothetical protein
MSEGNPDVTWSKFDEYSRISVREEQERLKNVVIQLNNWEGSVVYVVVYAGKESCVNEAKTRANRVKRFLKQEGINPKRIRVVDAGYLHSWKISLYIAHKSAPPLTATFINGLDRHLAESEVRISKNCQKVFDADLNWDAHNTRLERTRR